MDSQVKQSLDVLVIGGGNAALCAAITAREAGASILILETSQKEWRGGNSAHTRNIRAMHEQPEDVMLEAYREEEYWQDVLKVTSGKTDERLARFVIRGSTHNIANGFPSMGCTFSHLYRGLSIYRVPMHFLWVEEKHWSMPITEVLKS